MKTGENSANNNGHAINGNSSSNGSNPGAPVLEGGSGVELTKVNGELEPPAETETFNLQGIDNVRAFKIMIQTAKNLDSLERVHQIKSTYKTFSTPGDKVRGVFIGYCQIKGRNGDMLKAVRWIDKDGKVFHNAATILVDDISQYCIPEGAAIEITYTGDKTTQARKNKVQEFSVFILRAPDPTAKASGNNT